MSQREGLDVLRHIEQQDSELDNDAENLLDDLMSDDDA